MNATIIVSIPVTTSIIILIVGFMLNSLAVVTFAITISTILLGSSVVVHILLPSLLGVID